MSLVNGGSSSRWKRIFLFSVSFDGRLLVDDRIKKKTSLFSLMSEGISAAFRRSDARASL